VETPRHGRHLGVAESETLIDIVSMSTYIGDEFVQTVKSAPSFNSMHDVEGVDVILMTFVCLWGAGLLLIGAIKLKKMRTQRLVGSSTPSPRRLTKRGSLRRILPEHGSANPFQEYLEQVIPSIFFDDSTIQSFVDEVWKHHAYLQPIRWWTGAAAEEHISIKMLALLTMQTALVWLAAIFFDLNGEIFLMTPYFFPPC